MKQSARTHAGQLLDKLKLLDRTTTRAYYEMGQILHSFRESKLYDVLGYPSFAAMIEEELSFTLGTATGYAALFGHFKRLRYNKTESLKLLETFGIRHLKNVLPKVKAKVGTRAIKSRIEALGEHQMTFWMRDPEFKEVTKALKAMGAEVDEKGRFINSSEALIAMACQINGTSHRKAA